MFPIFRSKSVENSRCTQDVDVSMDVDPGSSLGNHFYFFLNHYLNYYVYGCLILILHIK